MVCDRWAKLENFLADMGDRPPGLQLDRINNDGWYEPGNCRWATREQQMRNTSRTKLSEMAVRTAKRLREYGMTLRDIGDVWGTSARVIHQATTGKTWR
jgi:hypothetical protein